MCSRRVFGEPDGLCCDNEKDHEPGHGCTYTNSAGSSVNDRHGEGGHG